MVWPFNGLNLILPTYYHLFVSKNIYHLIVKSPIASLGTSVLEPILFKIYFIHIFEIFNKYPDINYNADDLQMYLNCTDSPAYCPDRITNCISDLLKWIISNSLKCNPITSGNIVI